MRQGYYGLSIKSTSYEGVGKGMNPTKIALLTDSCADLTDQMKQDNSIYTIPLRIRCADGEYADGVDISASDIYTRLKAGELPQTSLPSSEDVEKILQEITDAGYDGVIAVMLSSALSGTYNLVRILAEEYQEEHKIQIRVFDSRNGSLGLGLTLLQIVEEIRNGMRWEELTERRVPQLIDNIYPFFSVNTLEYLYKGGRIGRIAATAGMVLNIKPVITFSEDGQLQSIAKVRGRKHLIDKLVALTVQRCEGHKKYNLGMASGGSSPEEVAVLRRKLTEALPDYEHLWEGEIDGTLSVYIGDGVLGAGVQILD